jgi:hypothetical protein
METPSWNTLLPRALKWNKITLWLSTLLFVVLLVGSIFYFITTPSPGKYLYLRGFLEGVMCSLGLFLVVMSAFVRRLLQVQAARGLASRPANEREG